MSKDGNDLEKIEAGFASNRSVKFNRKVYYHYCPNGGKMDKKSNAQCENCRHFLSHFFNQNVKAMSLFLVKLQYC